MESRARHLSVVLSLLALACAAVLAFDPGTDARRPASASFHRAVGGLGFGPSLDLGGCACGFDPRLEARCGARRAPLPGGAKLCPRHDLGAGDAPPR